MNRRERERRARIRANARTSGYFQTEAWRAVERERSAATRASKEARALTRRRMLRIYGPRPDGIKLLIRTRQAEAFRKRLTGQDLPGIHRNLPEFQYHPASNDYAAHLAAMRSKHKAERL